MRTLTAAFRLLRVLLHALHGWWIITFLFPRLQPRQREARVQIWAIGMLTCLGIRLQVLGASAAAGPVLLVSNHISWLDILVLHAGVYCRFVSKADVRHWPLVGALATGAGTLYIERASRRDAMRVVHQMADALRGGDVLAVFPEGTTGDGLALLPFHANLLQAAISADVPAQPVLLRFIDARTGQPSLAPSYMGDTHLLTSMWRTLTAPSIVARLRFGAVQGAAGRDRRAWAAGLRSDMQVLMDAASSPGVAPNCRA